MSEIWDDEDVPDADFDDDGSDGSPTLVARKRPAQELFVLKTSQPDEDEQSGEDDEEDDLLVAANKRARPSEPAKPIAKLPAAPAPAAVQISEAARQRQQSLAAKLARFKSCELELEKQQQEEPDPGKSSGVVDLAVEEAAAAAAHWNQARRPAGECSTTPVDLMNSEEDEAPIDWQQAAHELGMGPSAGSSHEAEPGPAADGDGKIQLAFKTKDGHSIKVRVVPADPLQSAFDKFLQHAIREGWVESGMKPRFVFDGDKLAGSETAANLDLEDDMIIEVFY